ncbi:MAG: hypothetical protein ACRD6X_13180 [Pyrinomonadaceae bacterium]
MLFRTIALSLALIIGIGAIIPLATEYAEAGPKKSKRYKSKQKRYWRGVKKYSKRWWQLYRAQERRKKLNAKRRRSLRLRQLRLAKARMTSSESRSNSVAAKKMPMESSKTAVLPSGQSAPNGWKSAGITPGELQFRIDGAGGSEVGSASISVVGPAMGASVTSGRNTTLAGVPTTSLRRDVINRMINENGWVVNDYQKEVGGRTVYVVVAQSQGAAGRVNSRMFYFTEADGRIYSVATKSSADSAERLAEESEKVINSLQNRSRPVQQASINKQ